MTPRQLRKKFGQNLTAHLRTTTLERVYIHLYIYTFKVYLRPLLFSSVTSTQATAHILYQTQQNNTHNHNLNRYDMDILQQQHYVPKNNKK